MARTVVFLSESRYSDPIAVQREACAAPGDRVILSNEVRFSDLVKATIRNNELLGRGDRLRLYDLQSIMISTGTLVRILTKLLTAGVTIEISSEQLVIEPVEGDPVFAILRLLNGQKRALHAVRTHAPEVKIGRKHALADDQWPQIRELVDARATSLGKIAAGLGVGRTTLFNFVKRMRSMEEHQAGGET